MPKNGLDAALSAQICSLSRPELIAACGAAKNGRDQLAWSAIRSCVTLSIEDTVTPVKPFWVDYGKAIWPTDDDLMFQIGLFPTTFGIVLSVIGALMGGAFISRYGIFHGVWFLGLLQAVSNLGYALVYWLNLGRFGLYGASMFESLSGGLGTAAFLAFLMNVCDKEHATVQYAFLSSIFSLTGRLIGGFSGLGAERYGYGNYFAITFVLSLPAYALLPWVAGGIKEPMRQ